MADAMVHGGAPMLDIARRDGHLIALLVPGTGTSLVGADWSPAELEGARRRLGPSVPLVRADAARLPIASAAL
jgi:ubiquinone/menaquinone biosynthesis C-methylase UbiE